MSRWCVPSDLCRPRARVAKPHALCPYQVPRALKQSVAPVELVPRGTLMNSSLALEYGVRVPLGASQEQLQVGWGTGCRT